MLVDVHGGKLVLRLDGGDYHQVTVPFSACFARHRGREVFVHRTAWNRLDVTDPATAESLTERHIAPFEREARPAHYLDYFHGRLLPSADSRFIFDDGWVWQPCGVSRIWSLSAWLETNPFESEDGSSVIEPLVRADWTLPACWLDDRTLALWGLDNIDDDEDEEDAILRHPGVRIVSADQPQSSEHRQMEIDLPGARISHLFSDGARLYAATPTDTLAWDLHSGVHLGQLTGFAPRMYDRSRRALISVVSHEIGQLSLP